MTASESIASLVGLGYEEVGGCWGLVVRGLAEGFGVTWPEHAPDALDGDEPIADPVPAGEAPRPGDVVLMRDRTEPQHHVGLVIDHGRFIHAMGCASVRIDRLAPFRRNNAIIRIVRPRRGP